jgi:hypothetical protein
MRELAPHMRAACSFDDAVVLVEAIEARIAVSMEHTAEVLQMRDRVLAFAVRGIKEQGCRRSLAATRSSSPI